MPTSTTRLSSRPKTVLIVEDSPVQALALAALLQSKGLQVISASNGLEGLEKAREQMPDIILLDFQMPEMDGLEACKHLKLDSRTTAIPVILLTSTTQDNIFTTSFEEGAVEFIPKDAFSNMVLLETLRQLKILPFTDGGW